MPSHPLRLYQGDREGMEVVSFKLYQRKLIADDLSAMFYNSRGWERVRLAATGGGVCVCVCMCRRGEGRGGGWGGLGGGGGERQTDRDRDTERAAFRICFVFQLFCRWLQLKWGRSVKLTLSVTERLHLQGVSKNILPTDSFWDGFFPSVFLLLLLLLFYNLYSCSVQKMQTAAFSLYRALTRSSSPLTVI